MHRLNRVLVACSILAACTVAATATAGANTKKLAIESAAANLEQEILLVSGRGFTENARVWLLDQGELVVLNVSPELIEARLPQTVPPGTYRLVVSTKRRGNAQHSAAQLESMDVTIGATGPRGPQGIPGVPGPPGDPGAPGPRGATWTSGGGAPDPVSGRDGDFYLDTDTGDVYVRADPMWNLIANLTGPEGPAGEPGASNDPIANLASRLGVHRPDIKVPLEAVRPSLCSSGDMAVLRVNGTESGNVFGVWGRESLDETYEFHILLEQNGGSPNDFIGQPGRLTIATAGGALNAEGLFTEASTLGDEGNGAQHLLKLEAALAKGKYASSFDAYESSRLSDIMNDVLDNLGVPALVTATQDVEDYVVQYNETDLQFLKRLAQEAGAFFYTQDDGTVVVSTSNAGFAPGPALPYLGPFVDPGSTAAAISSFSAGGGAATRQVKVYGWDYRAKQTVEGESDSAGSLPISLVFDPLYTSIDAANRGAEILYERAQVEASERHGTSNAPGIRAGRTITVNGVGGGFSGSFYVTSAQHVLYPDEETGCFAYGNQFTAVPSSIPYRPASVAPRPRVFGLQTGIVTNNMDPDGLGRVKVNFPWTAQGVESHWARVVLAAGVSQWSLPEVDDEVLVAFIGGDPRHPVVIGSLFNGQDAPPTSP